MERSAGVRREAGLELQRLAEEFERSDGAAFRRSRVACWIVTVLAGALALGLLMIGGDWRHLGAFWLIVTALAWGAYWLSSRRQREQNGRLRALAIRWIEEEDRPAA